MVRIPELPSIFPANDYNRKLEDHNTRSVRPRLIIDILMNNFQEKMKLKSETNNSTTANSRSVCETLLGDRAYNKPSLKFKFKSSINLKMKISGVPLTKRIELNQHVLKESQFKTINPVVSAGYKANNICDNQIKSKIAMIRTNKNLQVRKVNLKPRNFVTLPSISRGC